MKTFEERYQEWKQKKAAQARSAGGAGSFDERYTEWKMKNRGLDLKEVGQQVTDRVSTWMQNHNNYIQNYKNRFGSRKYDYTDSYVSDSREWLDTVSQQARNFDIESNAIRGILEQYGSYFDPEWTATITKALDEGRSQQGQIRKAAAQDVSLWSQFKDEDDYKAAQTYDEQSKADLDHLYMELEDLEKQLEPARQIQAQIGAFNPHAYVDASSAVAAEKELKDQLAEATAPWGGMAGMEAAYSEKQQYYNTAKRIQNGMKLAGVADASSEYYDPQFSQHTQYEQRSGVFDFPSYDNIIYDAVNKQNVEGKVAWGQALKALDIQDLNRLESATNLSDSEISIYNYYYNKEGREKAEEYLDTILENVNYRIAAEKFKTMENKTLGEVFFGIATGVDQFLTGAEGIKNAIAGKDDYIPNSSTQILGGMVREDLEDDGFKVFGSSLGQMAYDFLSTTTNMVPSLAVGGAVGLINPVAGQMVGAGLLGASAAGNAYKDMINQGYSKEQAGTYSALVGASEAGLSYLLGGIGKLGGKVSGHVIGKIVDKIDNVFGRVAVKLGGTMLSEGFEEGLQEILTPWFQEIATNIEQDVNWEEAAYSSLLGALTGLFMEGPGVVANTYSTAQTGKALQTAGVTAQELTAIGTKLDPESVAYQLSERVNARETKGKKTNAYTMGRMWNEIGQGMTEQNATELTKALQDKGYSAQEAKTIAKTFSAVTAGEAVTQKQINMLTRDSKVAEVIKNEILGKDSGISQRRTAYQQVADKLEGKTKAQPQSEATPAKEPTVSTDGKTYLVDTGEAVESLQIESVGNGSITYKVGDKTVGMDGIEYATPQEAMLHEVMSKSRTLNVRAANFMAQHIDPNNSRYILEAIDSYQAGWYGYDENKLDSFRMPLNHSHELYAYGKKAREEYDAKQKQAQSEARAAAEAGTKAKGTRGVFFNDMKGTAVEIDKANQSLSKKERVGVETAKFLHELGLGGEIHFFRSEKVNGKWMFRDAKGNLHSAPNGMYTGKDGKIYIDLNTFAGSKGATLYTLAHELTHFIENNSPQQYKVLADFLINEYDKTGMDMDQRVQRKLVELELIWGKEVSYDEAFRETVADSMQKLFNDGNLQQELVKLHQSSPEGAKVVQAIKKFIDRLLRQVQKIYATLKTGSEDAETVAKMGGSLAKLQKIFAAALVEASDNYTAYGAVVLDADAETQYSTKNDGKFMNKAIDQNAKSNRVAENVMRKAQSVRAKIANRMNAIREAGKIAIPEDIEGNTFFGNSSYGGSEENTTICPRSLAAESFVDAVSELVGRPLTVEEQIYISQDLQQPGRSSTPECTYCYVATDRKAYRAFLGEYVKQRDSVIEAYKNGNTDTARSGNLYQEFLNGRKDTDNMWKRFSMWINTYKNGTPMVEASHLASMEKLMGDIQSEFGKELKVQIKDAMAYAQSASWAKKRVGYVAYNGHILKWKQDRINKLNSHYGLRMYSFSDFSPAFILENMQMITDAAVRGLKMLGYTKELDFVKIFAPSGMNINISTFGFERAGNVYENNIIGANWEEAKALREKHPNVGITFVATNDTLVEWAMEQDWIDVVIPYHLVRTGKELAQKLGFKDYTGESADVKDKGWTTGNQKSIAPTEHNNDKATYLDALQRNHLRPRFERYIDNPNYMKLVNECRQSASESKSVQPIFDETAANESLAKLEANGYYQPVGGAVDRMYEIATDIADDIANGRVQFQARKDTPDGYGGIREVLAKKGLDELSKKLGNNFPLSAQFDSTMRADKTPLVMETVLANGVQRAQKESAFATGKRAFRAAYGSKTSVHINQMEINADLYVDVAKESIDKAQGKPDEQSTLDVIPHIRNILENSILMGMERIAHTDNKGTVLYGYRLYNLYWYQNGNKKTPNCLVCTVVQDLNKAEGYVFQNIENVTVRHGLPGENTGMPEPSNGNIYTVSQLYDAVKKIDRENGGLKYSDAQRNLYLFDYTERNDGVAYQARPLEETTNRYLLVNALESAAQTPEEKQKLQEYRNQIKNAEDLEDRLYKLNKQIFEQSFAPGPRNTQKLTEMQETAKRMTKQLDRMDKKLLGLEATKPMKDLLERERKLERQRTSEKHRDAMKQRTKSRQETEMRHKVQNAVKKLNRILLNESKDKHVPEGMKSAVADILDSINMDTVDAESRIQKLQEDLEKAMKAGKTELVQEISRKIDNVRNAGDKLGERVAKLHAEYEKIKEDSDPVMQNAYDDGLSAYFSLLVSAVGDTPLRRMTMEQMQGVYDICTAVSEVISRANENFLKGIGATVEERAVAVQEEIARVGGSHRETVAALDGIKGFAWGMLKPIFAMRAIGSDTLIRLFENIRKGEDVWYVDIAEAKNYLQEQQKQYGYKDWDFEKEYAFESTTGSQFKLTLEQIMSLYALSKREKALPHLQKGGFVYDSDTKVVRRNKLGIPVEYTINTADAHNLSPEILADIVGTLTEKQKGYVDAMQSYLSNEMAQKGNVVSMALYNLRLFKEKNYFPLVVSDQFLEKKNEPTGDRQLKNAGFTKPTKPKANKPVVLSGFTDVWAEHVNDMSMYHAFVLPLEDFNRVYNFNSGVNKEYANSKSVRGVIQNAYGKNANAYIDQMLKDINGGARKDPLTDWISKGMRAFKKGSVFASLSVMVQQFSAIARAAALVEAVYFCGPKMNSRQHKETWKELKHYAPVAGIKEMGYFDTNMGRSTVDYITAEELETPKEKLLALFKKDSTYRDDLFSKLPAWADEVSWCYIWAAVKRETAAKNREMDRNSEEFLQKAGERFTEVITRTQVYDSVLSRSQMMRSKDTGLQMATAFMSEPTTSINMTVDAIIQHRRGVKGSIRRIHGAVAVSQIFNAALVSLVYAARDDDEDETYGEKYLGSFIAELVDNLNPLASLPFIRDVISIFQGYTVERSDMAVISDLYAGIKNLESPNMSAYKKVETFVGSLFQLFGIPLKNLMRDGKAIYQTAMRLFTGGVGIQTTETGIRLSIAENFGASSASTAKRVFAETLAGNVANAEKLFNKLVQAKLEEGYTEAQAVNSANSTIRTQVKNAYIGGKISREKAEELVKRYGIQDGKEAEKEVKKWEYEVQYGHAWGNRAQAYRLGEISEEELVNAIMDIEGDKEEEAQDYIRFLDLTLDNMTVDISSTEAYSYFEYAEAVGIDVEEYLAFKNEVGGITGDKDEDGKTIRGSKKEKVLALIDSLPFSGEQKDALYLSCNYAENTLSDAPWH